MSPEGEGNRSVERDRWRAEHLNENTLEWLAEDERWFLHQALSTPCLNVLAHCQGSYIEDLQGRRYLDFHGNNVHHVGFTNPRVVEAITKQMRELSFCTRRYTNIPAIRLAKKLAEIAPGRLNKVLFAPGGTSVVGMALKLARAATGRFKTISLWDSFHGASLDSISLGGEEIFRRGMEPLLPGSLHVPPPDPAQCPWRCGAECSGACAEHVDYVMRREGGVGAVIVETVRATSLIPPPRYLQTLRDACDRHGALLIFDEIPHALGRTGRMFTCENFGVVPDILLVGKALGGGIFPLAALIAREDLDVAGDTALGHYTHEKNPVACAAALAAIECIEEEGLPQRAREMGIYTLGRLREIQARRPAVRAVRGLGLLLGVELDSAVTAERAMYRALESGLSFKVTGGTVLTLTPPLTISREEMDEAIAILDRALGD
jgi:(R)-1-hydroxy-2-aminoethylphosphonate ammonia-lyase